MLTALLLYVFLLSTLIYSRLETTGILSNKSYIHWAPALRRRDKKRHKMLLGF